MRAFLDSRHRRHLAADVLGRLDSGALPDGAVAAAPARWPGWRIGRRTSRKISVPVGMPYLAGCVLDAAIAAKAAAA